MKILDSDHWIALLRKRIDLRQVTRPDDELAITTISIGEITYGAYRSARIRENLADLDVLLAKLTILPFDENCARRYGYLRAQMEREGQRLADLDLQIASIAIEAGAPLVTHNTRHYERLAGEGGLQLEDWLAD